MYKHITHTVDTTTGLGFAWDQVGNYSICSSLVIALYLAKRAVSTIMLIGCWGSDAVFSLRTETRARISAGKSADMVAIDNYFTIPNLEEVDSLDPCTRNRQSFVNTISLNGSNAATAHCKAPSLHIWH